VRTPLLLLLLHLLPYGTRKQPSDRYRLHAAAVRAHFPAAVDPLLLRLLHLLPQRTQKRHSDSYGQRPAAALAHSHCTADPLPTPALLLHQHLLPSKSNSNSEQL
jgi:hypothetical protein